MTEEGTHIKVVVAPNRSLKRGGRYYDAGAELEIPRTEYHSAPKGLYVIPGTISDPVEEARQSKAKADEIDRADKLRRMAEDQRRREEAAARDAQVLEERAKMAQAANARLRQRKPAA